LPPFEKAKKIYSKNRSFFHLPPLQTEKPVLYYILFAGH